MPKDWMPKKRLPDVDFIPRWGLRFQEFDETVEKQKTKKVEREEKVARILFLREKNMTYRNIGKEFGVSDSTIRNFLARFLR